MSEEAEDAGNATEAYGHSPSWVEARPQRGLCQQFKRQIKEALVAMQQVKEVSKQSPKLSVLEVFAGSATLTMVALEMAEWKVYEPVDILLDGGSHDLTRAEVRERLKAALKVLKPDLVTMTPPCGPWSQWQHQRRDFEALERERKEQLPFWRLVADIWEEQTAGGRLALTEQPSQSEALDLSMMQRRKSLWRVNIDQCMFGAKDPVSQKAYKKPTALDVNDYEWGQLLANWPRCNHRPEEHEQIKCHVRVGQVTMRRSTLAGRWPRRLAPHVMETAQAFLQRPPHPADVAWKLHQHTESKDWIDTMAVEDVGTREETLRRQLQDVGAEGRRFDYVTFEGTARGLPRKIRSTLAHIHVTLGHLSNERLARMLSLAGASRALVDGAKQLSCQVCKMVRGPAATPKVSYDKPTNFNQKISGDCFHVWDINKVRYTVAHFIDELTDYQIADVEFDPQSTWIARVLREKWYLVFGTPEVVVTDEGREFKGAVVRLHELCGILHELALDQAKWRLGHAERHGAILKIILMKIIVAMQIDSLEEMKWAVTYAVAAKNRLVHHGGVSPQQAVTGKNTAIPGSMLEQISSGHIRFRANEELSRDEALRRADRIRANAIEACHWLDAHEGLRRALNARSINPQMASIKEGTTVYVYDPPAERKGLARRLQDNVSWTGPGVITCIEKEGNAYNPKRIWVRIRGKVKVYPLEKIRLATAEEMVSADYITNALLDVQKELDEGRLQLVDSIRAIKDKEEKKRKPRSGGQKVERLKDQGKMKSVSTGRPPEKAVLRAQEADEDQQGMREKKLRRVECLEDLPLQFKKPEREKLEEDPSTLPFAKKQKIFEEFAKEYGASSTMGEAALRGDMEDAVRKMKALRKTIRKEAKEKARKAASKTEEEEVNMVYWAATEAGEEIVEQFGMFSEVFWHEMETMGALWTEGPRIYIDQIALQKWSDGRHAEHEKEVLQAELVTGKLRVELQWKNLDEQWRAAFKEPLIKAVRVYFDHGAVEGVPLDAVVDPRKILTSRFVLTNKGEALLKLAELKARWILGGHRDSELGNYATMAPTSALLGHNMLNFLAVQMGWTVYYEDVSAAFLQREVYVKLPHGYPDYVIDFIREKLGDGFRTDILKLLKGGFGLAGKS